MWIKFFTLLFALLGLCSTALAETPALPYAGVWAGTLGGSKVQVCFTESWDSSYFYLRHKRAIHLQQNERSDVNGPWNEGAPGREATGLWELNQPKEDTLQGNWTNSKTSEKLPIHLRRLSKIKGEDCGYPFYAPILGAMTFKTGSMKFEGRTLTTIKTGSGTAFEMPLDTQNAEKINEYIKNWLEQQAIANYRCQISGDYSWHENLEPFYWTPRWLVLKEWERMNYCGGAHGSGTLELHTFDLSTGQRQNTWQWISKKTDGSDFNIGLGERKTKLRLLVEKRNTGHCNENFFFVEPHLTKTGMGFSTGYCRAQGPFDDVVIIPYKDLMPFLTPAGKAAVASIVKGE